MAKGLEASLNQVYKRQGELYVPDTDIITLSQIALNPDIGRRSFLRAAGATGIAGLATACAPALEITGRFLDGDKEEKFTYRAGQEPKKVDPAQVATNLILPVSAVIDNWVFDLYSNPVHAIDGILCKDNGYTEALKQAGLPKDISDKFYKAACEDYSEVGVAEVLEKLDPNQKDALTKSVKDTLNKKLGVYSIKASDDFAQLAMASDEPIFIGDSKPGVKESIARNIIIDDVTIEDVMHSYLRETLELAANAGFWYGVATAVAAITGSEGSSGVTVTGAAPAPPPVCLLNGSKVLINDNETVEIQNLKVGDEIASFNEKTGKITTTKITMTIKEHPREAYFRINSSLKITNDHPVLVSRNDALGWVRVDKLDVGDKIKSTEGFTLVESIEKINEPATTVYLETESGNFITKVGNSFVVVSGKYKPEDYKELEQDKIEVLATV